MLQEVMTNVHYSGYHKATQEEKNQRTPGKDVKKGRWKAGFKYSWRKMKTPAQDRA